MFRKGLIEPLQHKSIRLYVPIEISTFSFSLHDKQHVNNTQTSTVRTLLAGCFGSQFMIVGTHLKAFESKLRMLRCKRYS